MIEYFFDTVGLFLDYHLCDEFLSLSAVAIVIFVCLGLFKRKG